MAPFEDSEGPSLCGVCMALPKRQTLELSMAQEETRSTGPRVRHGGQMDVTYHILSTHITTPGPNQLQDGMANSRMKPVGWGTCPFFSSLVLMKPSASGRHDVNGRNIWEVGGRDSRGSDADPDTKIQSVSQKHPPCGF